MAWFKVDDSIPFHPKVVAAGNLAIGLWLRAGGWCAQQMTEGFIPTGMLAPLGGTPSTARKLVGAGLWDVAEGGWRFHDWHTYQPTRAEVEGRRKQRAEAGAKGGRRPASPDVKAKLKQTLQRMVKQTLRVVLHHPFAHGRSKTEPRPVPLPKEISLLT